jgi:hypothetical protein
MTKPQDIVSPSRWANVRLTEEEHKALDAIQERLSTTRSRLLRKAVRELIGLGPDLLPQEWKAFEDLAFQVAAVGRNLNQLVKAIHQGKAAIGPEDRLLVEGVSDRVREVQAALQAAIERSRQRWVKDAA